MKSKEQLLFVPLVGKTSRERQKEGLKLIKDLPLLPRLTAVLPPQGREMTTYGFTLIELLVVVLIIGILAAVALPQYQKAVLRTRFVQMHAHINAIMKAQQAYYLNNGTYASSLGDLDIEIKDTDYVLCSPKVGNDVFCYLFSKNSRSDKYKLAGLERNLQTGRLSCCSYGNTSHRAGPICAVETGDFTGHDGGCGKVAGGCTCYTEPFVN